MAQQTFNSIALSANLPLVWMASLESGTIAYDLNNVTPTAGGFKISLPNATGAQPGQTLTFNNISAYSFQLVAFDGTTVIKTVDAGELTTIFLGDTSTTNGTWYIYPASVGTAAITTVTAQSSNGSVTITGSPLSSPGGTLNFTLPTSLTNLNALATTGVVVAKTTAPLTWGVAELIGGENIVITNGTGISDDPIINVNETLTNLSSVQVGTLTIATSLIATNVTNGSVDLSSAGTGKVNMNGVGIDTSGNITGVNNLTITGTFNNALTPKAFITFTDVISGSSNVITLQDKSGFSTVTGSHGSYTATFSATRPNTNYAVVFGIGTAGGSPATMRVAYWLVKGLTTLTFTVVDASGELVTSIPEGMSIMIMATT